MQFRGDVQGEKLKFLMGDLDAILKQRRAMGEGTIWADPITDSRRIYLGAGRDAANLTQVSHIKWHLAETLFLYPKRRY